MRPSQGEQFIEVGKSQNGGLKTGCLEVFEASRASVGRSTCSDFLSLFSPLVRSYRGAAILAKPLMKRL